MIGRARRGGASRRPARAGRPAPGRAARRSAADSLRSISAIGPCLTSAPENASAWMPQTSLNFSAASMRDRQADAAADHEQAVARRPARRPARDQSACAARLQHASGSACERRLQLRVVLPLRDQARAGHQLRDVALGRGHARFGAGVQRQHPLRRPRPAATSGSLTKATVRAPPARKKRVGSTGPGSGPTARSPRHQALASMRRLVQRDERHRQRGHQAAQARHDQVGDVVAAWSELPRATVSARLRRSVRSLRPSAA